MRKLFFTFLLVIMSIVHTMGQTLVTSVEAELGTLSGVTLAAPSGNSSGQYVTGFDASGDKLTLTINVTTAALYNVSIRYRALNGTKTNDLYANGIFVSSSKLGFPGSCSRKCQPQ